MGGMTYKRCLVSVAVFFCAFSCVWCVDITRQVFGDNTNYLPAAFGDFNSDKLTDLFVVTEDGKTVKVLISHTDIPLMHANSQEMPNCTYKSLNIVSVVPGDFDGNGEMDVMIVSLKKSKANLPSLYQVFILWGNLNNMTLDCGREDQPLLNLASQPLVMDYNGDMIPDLFGENENHTRMFWVFSSDRTPPQSVSMTKDASLPRLKRPSSHGFVDMNNDLAADLWVTAEGQFELWKMTGDGYILDKVIKPSALMNVNRIGQTSFADVNLDGHIDVLVPACKDANCKQSALFVRDYESDLWIDVDISFVDPSGNRWSYPTEKNSNFRYTDTITLHVGDFNLDGYPDFLVTLFNNNRARVTLMENMPCDDSKCRYKRKFVPHWNLFQDFNDTVLGTFCDFEEDGTLDVLLVRKGADNKYQLSVYKDAIEYDAVFVKVLIQTGRRENHKNPYSTNQPGPSITYSITTATGGTQTSRATQLSQSAHHALHLPYTVFGLGRNWNFMEEMTIGIPKSRNDSTTLTATFTQIIPNSQLVVIPYPLAYPEKWVSKLFITPSKAMLMTGGALVGTCVFVAAIIGILHRREMQQDKREKQQDAHKFHFDAM